VKDYISIFALISTVFAAYFALLSWRVDRRRALYPARAALYIRIREGEFSQSRQQVRNLTSTKFYESWSVCIRSGQRSDVERLLMQLAEEEKRLAIDSGKKNWAKPASILMATVSAATIIFSASEAVAIVFPNSWWAGHCREYHACVLPSDGFHSPHGSQTRWNPRTAEAVAPGHQAQQALIPTKRAARALPAKTPARGHGVTTAPSAGSSVVALSLPQSSSSDCGTIPGEVPCVVKKVADVTGRCVLQPLENLVDVTALSVNLSATRLATRCITSGQPGLSTSAVAPTSSSATQPAASTGSEEVAPPALPQASPSAGIQLPVNITAP
jgi:hypothetical protein